MQPYSLCLVQFRLKRHHKGDQQDIFLVGIVSSKIITGKDKRYMCWWERQPLCMTMRSLKHEFWDAGDCRHGECVLFPAGDHLPRGPTGSIV